MRIGELNQVISIEKQSNISDGMGGVTTTWVDHLTGSTSSKTSIWAAIWPTTAKEQILSEKEIGTITHKIRIRYRSGITSDMRVKYKSQSFNIIAPPINPNFSNKMLDLICVEVAV